MNRIKEVLKAQGRSQEWLSRQIGKSYVVTTNYVNNKTQPSILTLNKMAKAMEIDVRELLVSTSQEEDKEALLRQEEGLVAARIALEKAERPPLVAPSYQTGVGKTYPPKKPFQRMTHADIMSSGTMARKALRVEKD